MTNLQILSIGVPLFVSPLVVFGVWGIIASRYLDLIESHFSNSRLVNDVRLSLSGSGMVGKIVRTGSIAAMLSMHKFCERKGLIDVGDVKSLPKQLRKYLVLAWMCHLTWLISFVAFCVWIKFFRR